MKGRSLPAGIVRVRRPTRGQAGGITVLSSTGVVPVNGLRLPLLSQLQSLPLRVPS
jgi:hypothetical protein